MKDRPIGLDEENPFFGERYEFIDFHRNIILSDIVRCVKAKRKVLKEWIDALYALYLIEENIRRKENE